MLFNNDLTEARLNELFTENDKCLEFLADLKWADGFECRKCGNKNYCPGKSSHSRRCTKCKSEESATTGTIFHHCRFDINKAFYIAYSVCKSNSDISSYEFARRLSLRQMTCWKFKDKLKKVIEANGELSENWIEILK
jgi:hypothetical protein